MTRTGRYKLGYILAMAAIGAAALFAVAKMGGGLLVPLTIAAVLLVPGRVLGSLYRDLFRGRRLLEMRQFAASIPYTLRFLEYIRQNPGRKKWLWLAWSMYTPDAEAMALNNLGAAYIELGELDAAATALKSAIEIDPEYPIPYYNLAIERAVAKDHAEAARLLAEAERLGYRRTSVDMIIHEAQALLARLEGRGATAEPPSDGPRAPGH